MEKTVAREFGPEYTFIGWSQDVQSALDSIGLDMDEEGWGSLFVLVGDGEYLEIWASEYTVPYLSATYYKVL